MQRRGYEPLSFVLDPTKLFYDASCVDRHADRVLEERKEGDLVYIDRGRVNYSRRISQKRSDIGAKGVRRT